MIIASHFRLIFLYFRCEKTFSKEDERPLSSITISASYPENKQLSAAFKGTTSSVNTTTNVTQGSYTCNYAAPYEEERNTQFQQSNNLNKKKRERDMEQQLMSGDLTAISSVPVKNIGSRSEWNVTEYLDHQKQELMIHKSFGIGTTIKAINQPTKMQNKKHQLGSLALKAAQTELALLDARGARSKTKGETQAKYGW